MYRQKNTYKQIIVLLTLCLFVQHSYGIDLKTLNIGAEVNGHCVYDKILLKDKDNCSLFICDKDKKQITLPANYTTQWYICFIKNSGNYGEDKLLSNGVIGKCEFAVTPPFMGFGFGEGPLSQKYIDYKYTQKGIIKCKITDKTTEMTQSLYIPVEMDVLPHINEFKVREIYYEEEYGKLRPVVVFDVDVSNFNEIIFCIGDKDSGYYYITVYEDALISNTLICDYAFEDDIYALGAFNDYGLYSVGPVYADWETAGINNNTTSTDEPDITINGNTCNIKGERPLKSIRITDINGRCLLYDKNKKEVYHTLNKGIYIIHIITENNQKYTRKIMIKN